MRKKSKKLQTEKMNKQLYPLKFSPILKDKIWGGAKLKKIFEKPALSHILGESWELSGCNGDESVVANGFLAGKNIRELIEIYPEKLLGERNHTMFGKSFPLLFKLIDANENLSIQVHPGDEIAAKKHNSFGKTEMWYVIDADEGAELIIGFSKDCTRDEYLLALEAGEVENLLQKVPVSKGDVFFIPAGLVHAIGKGVLVAEIQQSSDITYRIFDYKRKDENGNERELHTDDAFDVIDFSAAKNPKINYNNKLNEINQLVQCEYFTTNVISFNKSLTRDYSTIDSFIVFMCIEGGFAIVFNDEKIFIKRGETVLIPAFIDEILLIPEVEGTFLEVYI